MKDGVCSRNISLIFGTNMKIEELSIGDWINVEIYDKDGSHTFEKDIICGISYLPRKDEMGVLTKHYGDSDELITLYDIEPIILSKAILSAHFSENLNEDYTEWFKQNNKTLFTVFCKNGLWNLIWDDTTNTLTIEDDPTLEMKYVHELQHYLRLSNVDIKINLENND